MTFAIRFDGDDDDDNDDGERNAYTRTRLSSLCIYTHVLYILDIRKYETRACCHKFYMYWRSIKKYRAFGGGGVDDALQYSYPYRMKLVYLHSSKSLVVSSAAAAALILLEAHRTNKFISCAQHKQQGIFSSTRRNETDYARWC